MGEYPVAVGDFYPKFCKLPEEDLRKRRRKTIGQGRISLRT